MSGKRWTEEEMQYLKKWWGRKDRVYIANHLKRPVSGVKNKASSMGLGHFLENSEMINTSEIGKLVGINKSTVRNWESRGLKVKHYPLYSMVLESDLLDFMKNNLDLWDARKCDYWMFHSFPWFMKKLKDDRSGKNHYYKSWTLDEIRMLTTMKRWGFSNQQIADKLSRSKKSVMGQWYKMKK